MIMNDMKNMLTVSQVNEYVRMLIDDVPIFSGLYVRGEISNFKNHYATGHFYFTIKDEASALKAVMFKSNAQKLGFVPKDGMKVIVHGRISAFTRDGVYQLYADDIQPDGVGALYFAFEQLKRKLEAEGLFDEARKRPIPRFPARIGIVTSPTGAAIRDMINILTRRYPSVEAIIYPAQVQGPSAPGQLCEGIRYFNEKMAVDTIIIGRGGGSLEDLWAFNNETLARHIAASRVPVISAVGHEVDFTISDFVADLRAPTPSAAAELAVPERAGLLRQLDEYASRADSAVERLLRNYRTRIAQLAESRMLASPERFVDEKKMSLAALCERLNGGILRTSERARSLLVKEAAQLGALNPFAVLTRGYAALTHDGDVIKTAKELSVGESVTIKLADGEAESEITKIKINGD